MARESRREDNSHAGRALSVGPEDLRVNPGRAAIGGGLAFLVTFLGAYLVGEMSNVEAFIRLNVAIESTRRLCQTVIIATATILALMLTLLGVSAGTEQELRWAHYQRIRQIAWIDAVALIGAVLTFLLLNVPLESADNLTVPLPTVFYYATLVLASLLGGALISVVLMLYNTIRDVIEVIGHGGAENLIADREDDE